MSCQDTLKKECSRTVTMVSLANLLDIQEYFKNVHKPGFTEKPIRAVP